MQQVIQRIMRWNKVFKHFKAACWLAKSRIWQSLSWIGQSQSEENRKYIQFFHDEEKSERKRSLLHFGGILYHMSPSVMWGESKESALALNPGVTDPSKFAPENNVNSELHLVYNCRWIMDSRRFSNCRGSAQMVHSLEDMLEFLRGRFGASKYSQKANRVAEISRTFMCKLDNDPIFAFYLHALSMANNEGLIVLQKFRSLRGSPDVGGCRGW
jgi:hypothetical protein